MFLALLATPAVIGAASALTGCSSDGANTSSTTGTPSSDNSPPDTSSASGVARSDKPRSAASPSDAASATTSVNDFGVDLYRALTTGVGNATVDQSAPKKNLVVSPASIAIALAMTRAGAKGTTATEMDTVLRVDRPDALAHSMNALSSALDSRTRQVTMPESKPVDVTLAIANSLWGQQGLAFETAFLDLLATEYGAGLQLVDYKADPEGARKLINAWVDDKTKQRIPNLLAQGTITPDARLTLVNAIYMKAPWLNPFPPDATSASNFTTIGGGVVLTPFMHLTEELNYSKGDGWQAVELPYVGNDLSMVVVLPDDGIALGDGVAAVPSVAGLATQRKVIVSMPTFDIETLTDLATLLAAMGMPTAFSENADFSAMTTQEQLVIGAVIHQANITVDEKGTEAAAATAVVMRATAAPVEQEPVTLSFDRPFVFAIRDNPTGAVLFLGHIGDPTETRS